MKIYISEEKFDEISKLKDFNIVTNYIDSDSVIIVPGGLSSLNAMLQGVIDEKDVYVYNKNLCYASIIEQLYQLYEKGIESKSPSEYLNIEKDIDKIVEKLEEKKNGKNDYGENSKLL